MSETLLAWVSMVAMLFWLQAGRSNGFTAGLQLRPHGPFSTPLRYMHSKDLSQISQEVAEHLSYAVAYSPAPSTSYAGGKLDTQHARTKLLSSDCAFSLS